MELNPQIIHLVNGNLRLDRQDLFPARGRVPDDRRKAALVLLEKSRRVACRDISHGIASHIIIRVEISGHLMSAQHVTH